MIVKWNTRKSISPTPMNVCSLGRKLDELSRLRWPCSHAKLTNSWKFLKVWQFALQPYGIFFTFQGLCVWVKNYLTYFDQRSFSGIYFYAPSIRRMRQGIKRCPCPSVRASVRPFVHHLSGYFVSATPPTIWSQSFWNFTHVFVKDWKCAWHSDITLKLFFVTFFTVWT